jgi:hypothetical protein
MRGGDEREKQNQDKKHPFQQNKMASNANRSPSVLFPHILHLIKSDGILTHDFIHVPQNHNKLVHSFLGYSIKG